jgi:transcriptional regulator with GAF, ATPase, and Fis domain
VVRLVRKLAACDATVLIQGETGTGKELIARAVHSLSRRKDRPLIKVNCAALPAGLLEAELFGRGASGGRVGRLELAHGGTLFLDEVGAVPAEIQARLMRLLQEREFEPAGGGPAVKVNVRVIATTNRDLGELAITGRFRKDLYYRLGASPIQLPPLRDRRDDIPLLTQFLVDRFAAQLGKRIEAVGPETMRRLMDYSWPGNIRELQGVLERAVLLSAGPVLEVSPDILAAPAPAAEPTDLATLERDHIRRVLERTRWVIDGPHGAARLLGLHPNTLRSRLKKLGLQRPRQEPPQ